MNHQYEEALERLDVSDQWCREQNWPRRVAWNNYFRGSILAQQGELPAAEPFLIESLEMASSWGERRLIARNKERLIQVYAGTTRLQLAIYTAQEAFDLYERLGMLNDAAVVKRVLQVLQGKNINNPFDGNVANLPLSTL